MARLEEVEGKEKCERVMTPDNSSTEESRNEMETVERNLSEDRDTIIEIEGEHGPEGDESIEVQKLCSGALILAKKSYKKNPDSPMGKEL